MAKKKEKELEQEIPTAQENACEAEEEGAEAREAREKALALEKELEEILTLSL